MHHQPQIVPDERFPRRGVARPQGRKGLDLFPCAQGLGEAPRFQMQRQHQKFRSKKLQQSQQHTTHLPNYGPPTLYERGQTVQKLSACCTFLYPVLAAI